MADRRTERTAGSGGEKLFCGIVPAFYTCCEDDGSVNHSETVRLAQWLAGKGVCGFYLCGSTGDGLFVSQEERLRGRRIGIGGIPFEKAMNRRRKRL